MPTENVTTNPGYWEGGQPKVWLETKFKGGLNLDLTLLPRPKGTHPFQQTWIQMEPWEGVNCFLPQVFRQLFQNLVEMSGLVAATHSSPQKTS